LEKGIGYVRISQFNEQTVSDFEKALGKLEDLNKASLRGLIIDLRNNPGGLLDQAVKVADKFITRGTIVSIEGRSKEPLKFEAHRDGTVENYALIVLVNSGSASGSEILAGALQDHRRALILGTKTFGKGSVQTIFPLKDGSGLKLTTAKYYTPKGTSIHAMGINPNIVVPYSRVSDSDDRESKKKPSHPLEKDLEGHLKGMEEEKAAGKPNEEKTLDSQLERALQIMKGWEIFQGLSLKK
jgi:carboxyl-terminal processing protease